MNVTDDRAPLDRIHVLHVDDQPAFAELAAEFLERTDDRIEVVTAASASEGLDRLASTRIDCVVSDYDMPGTNGLEFLEAVREEHGDLPFILFTGKGSEEVASEAISAGVTDYLQKEHGTDQYALLANRIGNAVEGDRAQRAAETAESRRQRMFERITDGFFAVDTDWYYTAVNEEGAQLVDRAPDELVGERVWDVFPNLVDTPFEEALRTAMESAETLSVEAEYPPLDAWFKVRVYSDADGISIFFRDVTDQHEREQRVETLARRFDAVFDNPLTMLGLLAPDGTLLEANRTALDLVDSSAEAVTGDPFWETPWWNHSPELQDELRSSIARAADGEYVRYEAEHPTREGEMRTVDGIVHPVRNDAGVITELIAVARDITERKEHESELAFRTALLEAQAEATIDGLLVVDDDRNVVFHNDRFRDIWDIPESVAAEESERTWIDHVSDEFEDPNALREQIDYLHEHRDETDRDTVQLIDGRWLDRYSAPVVDDEGTYYGRLWAVRDVTGRETAKQRIEALHDVTRDLVQAGSPAEIAAIAVDAARDVLDLPVTGCWLYDEDDDVLEPAAATDEAKDLVDDHPTYARGDGLSWSAFERGAVAVYDDLSTVEGTMNADTRIRSEIIVPLGRHGVLNIGATEPNEFDETDVSLARILGRNVEAALVRAERERELSRQNERLDEFASIVSHDLRNPLSVLDGTLELVEETGELDDLDRCRRAIDRMDALIDDLLVLAREGETIGDTEAVDLRELVENCWHTVETGDATLRVETDRVVRCDRSRARQLLENLVRNSVEHADASVTVTVGSLDDGFYVADDGPGVPAAERERVFESGYSTESTGTGYGLTIVARIAESHGWDVRLTESDGGGARFEVTGVRFVDG